MVTSDSKKVISSELDQQQQQHQQQNQQQDQSYSNNAENGKQNQDPSISVTPHSSSSTSTTSSRSKTSSGIKSVGKFKEKRPEPLKRNFFSFLDVEVNQDIPLDLSVKSAGNMPSEGVFSLASSTQLTTLETPRIIWQDNENLLTKSRLYSSSTSATSQRIRASLVGESPPMTPNTPSADPLVFSPAVRSLADDCHPPNSANMLLDSSSQQSLFSNAHSLQRQHQQRRQLDDSYALGKLTPTNRFLNYHHYNKSNEPIKTPRRSCSTDNLSSMTCNGQVFKTLQTFRSQHQQRQQAINKKLAADGSCNNNNNINKKNSISPLATKNLSSSASNDNTSLNTTFSYAGQLTADCNGISSANEQFSPLINITKNHSQSTNDNLSTDEGSNKKSLTPTSVANATANFFNIHINSPTSPMPSLTDYLAAGTKVSTSSAIHDPHNFDPLISAAYCQQHQQNQIMRSSGGGGSSTSSIGIGNHESSRHNTMTNFLRHSNHEANRPNEILTNGYINTMGSSTTLDTPTLVSPSQLKSASSICMQSPLSPLSSVFELPSPLLMNPPAAAFLTSAQVSSELRSLSDKLNSPTSKGSTSHPMAGVEDQQPKRPAKDIPMMSINEDVGTRLQVQSPINKSTSDSALGSGNGGGQASVLVHGTRNETCNNNNGRKQQLSNSIGNIDLSHLVTKAKDKIEAKAAAEALELQTQQRAGLVPTNTADGDDDKMDIDGLEAMSCVVDSTTQRQLVTNNGVQLDRPLTNNDDLRATETPIPRILVSVDCKQQQGQNEAQNRHVQSADPQLGSENHEPIAQQGLYAQYQQHQQQQQQQQRTQRDTVGKRALSPQSFKERVSIYRNERLESSSAPPDVCQSRAGAEQDKRAQVSTGSSCNVAGSVSNPWLGQPRVDQYALDHYSRNQHQQYVASRSLTACRQQSHQAANHFSNYQYKYNTTCTDIHAPCLHADGHLRSSSVGQSTYQIPSQAASGQLYQGLGQQQQQQRQHYAPQDSLHNYHAVGNGFSQSDQHLHSLAASNSWHNQAIAASVLKPHESGGLSVGQHQFQSASAGNLDLLPTTANYSEGPSFMSHHSIANPVASIQQQHQMATQRQAEPSSTPQGPLRELDDLIYQTPMPMQTCGAQSFGANHSQIQGQRAVGFQQSGAIRQQQQHLTRNLSADLRALSRSESSCSSADFCFRSKSAASSTATNTSLTAKKYQCDHCTKAFTRSDMLTRHKRLHSGDRPFQCHECKQEFSRSDHLSTHMRTHTGEKPYRCKLCPYSACRKDMITRHMKVHNRSSPNVHHQPMS